MSGADPGIFVRGGGPTFRKFLTSQKKKKKKKKKKEETKQGLDRSFPSAEVWLKSTCQKIIYIQIYFR